MKKIVLALFTMLFVSTSIFAQSDLQALAVVKYNKSESITVKQLKKRVGFYEKQVGRPLTLDERKEVMNTMIEETLLVQGAQKVGMSVTDSMVDQSFNNALSQMVGAPITEAQFEQMLKTQPGSPSIEDIFMEQAGLTKKEYKEMLKRQMLMQQYVIYSKQNELKTIAPSDEQIRIMYEAHKSEFIWKDMAKILVVMVPKGDNEGAAKVKLNGLKSDLADKKTNVEKLILQAQVEGSGFQAGEKWVEKDERNARVLGMNMTDLLGLFTMDEGFISDVIETPEDYRFFSIVKKTDTKMLGLSDIYIPDTTVTVYEYIRQVLTNQLQAQFLQTAVEELAKELNVPANVEMKKSGASLDKLLSWGE